MRVQNSRGETVTVRYRPSATRIIQKTFGFGAKSIDTFRIILPNNRIVPVGVIYNPGVDYEIFDPDNEQGKFDIGKFIQNLGDIGVGGETNGLNGSFPRMGGSGYSQGGLGSIWDPCSNCYAENVRP